MHAVFEPQRKLAAVILLLCLFIAHSAFAQVAVPELRSPVTDLTGTLKPDQIAALERTLRQFEARKGSQLAVLLVPTTQPETIEQYGIRVAEAWRVGRKDVDDGVILLVAKDDRAVRIEVGYGLEGVLPDVVAHRIIQQEVVPQFRRGEFYLGIVAAVERIIAVIDGEPLPEPARGPVSAPPGIGNALPVLLMLVIVGGGILRAIFGAIGGASVTAVIAGAIAWILTGTLIVGVIAFVLAFIFGLFGGGGRGWTNPRRRRGGSWSGGGFGGWGGSSGGGWSGGGGGFGGGGASGRW